MQTVSSGPSCPRLTKAVNTNTPAKGSLKVAFGACFLNCLYLTTLTLCKSFPEGKLACFLVSHTGALGTNPTVCLCKQGEREGGRWKERRRKGHG